MGQIFSTAAISRIWGSPSKGLAASDNGGVAKEDDTKTAVVDDSSNAIEAYRKQLSEERQKLETQLKEWKSARGIVSEPKDDHAAPLTGMHAGIIRFLHRIKEKLMPADEALDDLLQHTKDHVDSLYRELTAAVAELKTCQDKEKCSELRVKIYSAVITLLNELIALISSVDGELQECLDFDREVDFAINAAFSFLVDVITGMQVVFTIVNTEKTYPVFLEREIQEQRSHIDVFLSNMEASIEDAKRAVKESEKQDQIATFRSIALR